jgi:hypothetical protein
MDCNTELEIVEERLMSNRKVKKMVVEILDGNEELDSIQRLQLKELLKNL